MKQYYVDLNALSEKPLVLYTKERDSTSAKKWKIDNCWAKLLENSDTPLEKLILSLTGKEITRLKYKANGPIETKAFPVEWVNEMIEELDDKVYSLIDEIVKNGILNISDLRKKLGRYKKQVDYLDQDNEVLVAADIYPEDEQALDGVANKLAQHAPAAEIIGFINKYKINRYFSPETMDPLPVDFDQEKIAQIMGKDILERRAFLKFYCEYLTEFEKNYKVAEEQLNDPVFEKEETYARFPGIQSGKCWAATERLMTIDLGINFDHPTIARNLRDHPMGFIATANDHQNEVVVLPNREKVQEIMGSELFASNPLETDIKNTFAGRDLAGNIKNLLWLFDDFIKPQIEKALLEDDADAPSRVCVWIVLGFESVKQIIRHPQYTSFDNNELIKKINKIDVYFKQQQRKVPKKLYLENAQKRLEARRQINISKCFAVTKELNLGFIASQDVPTRNIKPDERKTEELRDLLAERREIMQQQKECEKARQGDAQQR